MSLSFGERPFVPDFVIVGAPRSGTTSLYTYLGSHTDICMSAEKEPMFWAPEIASPGAISGPREYADLWRGRLPGQLTGEASAGYVHSRIAVPAILAASPSTKLILSLRNPVDMARSLHSLLVRTGLEPILAFEEAWQIELPRPAAPPWSLVLPPYKEICAMGDHLERFLTQVPRPNRHIILFDELVADPRRVYRGVLDFLGLADDGRRTFPVMNANHGSRRSLLTKLGGTVPSRWAEMIGINGRRAPRPLSSAFRRELACAFRPQIEKMERLLGTDLQAWKMV